MARRFVARALAWAALGGLFAAPVLAAPVATETLPDCLARLARAQKQRAALEPEMVERLYPPKLFATGSPNPGAQAALRPVLERAVKQAAPALDASLALECRTWACRLLVLQPLGTSTTAWEQALARSPELRARVRDPAVAARRRTADALGQDLGEATVYLKLLDPSGEARSPEQKPRPRADDGKSPPTTPALCATEADQVERANQALEALIARALTPAQRFEREPANEGLTREMAALVREAAAEPPLERAGETGGLTGLAVQCRGVVCKVDGVLLDRTAWAQLEARPALRPRIVGKAYESDGDGKQHERAAYWLIRPALKRDGREVLAEVLRRLDAEPLFDACHDKHPARGFLIVRYRLAGDSVFGTSTSATAGARPAITTEHSGSLVDTPLGRCVADAITRALAVIPLPEERLQASAERRYDWPRPRRATPPR